jgi:hypothetical protein
MLTSLNGASGGGLLLRHMSSSGALLPGGQLPTDVPASAVAVARLLDGSWRLVVAGRAGEGPSDNQSRVVALTTAGALDPAFGGGDGVADLGTVAATGFGAPAPMASALPDGRLLAAFNLFVDGYEVVRLSDTGELEPTFGLNGRMSRAPTSPQGGDLLSLVADANGAMTLSITQRFDDPARSPYSSTLSRTTANGEIDGAFHPRGSRPGSVWLQELGVAGQAVGGTMVALRSGSVLVAATQSDPAFGVPSVAQIVRVQLPPRSRITAVAGAAQGSAPAVRAMNAHQG